MKTVKDKMYNYEVAPPSKNWQLIATALDDVNSIKSLKKNNKISYLSVAASAAILIFSVFMWFNISNNNKINNDPDLSNKITVPVSNKEGNNPTGRNLNELAFEAGTKKYIIVCSPQGEPVKISTKVASLIVSSDNQYPPSPIWSAKVNKWKDRMKANILAPTSANFLDIIELTQAVSMSKP